MNVRWTVDAESDIEAIYERLLGTSEDAAQATAEQIYRRGRQLELSPGSGQVVDDFRPLRCRMLLEQPYGIFDVVNRAEVIVLAVVHLSRHIGR